MPSYQINLVKQLLNHVLAWAKQQPDVRALLLVGSRARQQPSADAFSDLDFEIYTTTPEAYRDIPDWLGSLGRVWVCVPHTRGDGVTEHLVLYDEGQKVDLSFLPLPWLENMVATQKLTTVYHRGYWVLLDKDGLVAKLPPPGGPPQAERPSLDQFTQVIHAFWYGAVYVAKQIRRRQLWLVKYRDWTMKQELLQILEWRARFIRQADPWYDGKFMLDWADPETKDALSGVFGRFDAADSWRALLATMDLFRRLAQETAVALDYPYPTLLNQQVTGYVETLHRQDK